MPYPDFNTITDIDSPYAFTMSENMREYVKKYKEALIKDPTKAGKRLAAIIEAGNYTLGSLTDQDFLRLIINTKEPKNFGEAVLDDTERATEAGYSPTELHILANIGTVIPSYALNDGGHDNSFKNNHNDEPLPCLMGFLSAPLFSRGSPDYASLVKDGVIDQKKYTRFLEERMVPMLRQMSKQALDYGKQLDLTLPGLGCGMFAGEFRKTIRKNLYIAMQDILKKHACTLTGIKNIYLDTHDDVGLPRNYDAEHKFGNTAHSITFQCVASKHDTQLRKQLELGKNPDKNTLLGTVVAADLISWMGNDMWIDSRSTDEGVKGASTYSMVQIACFLLPGEFQPGMFEYKSNTGCFYHKSLLWTDIAQLLKKKCPLGYSTEYTPVNVYSFPAFTYPKSYVAICSKAEDSPLEKAIALLNDYTKSDSRASRMFHGHWNRHHTKEVAEIVKDNSIEDISTLVQKLEGIAIKNPKGSLAKRLAYIKENLVEEPAIEPAHGRSFQ